jgi:hypothetical protein
VTQNLKDFPDAELAAYGIDVQHPDEFLCNHLHLAPGVFCGAVQEGPASAQKPPYTTEQYLDTLTRQGLVATASELREFSSLL